MAIVYKNWGHYRDDMPVKSWVCGHCGNTVGGPYGYQAKDPATNDRSHDKAIYICPKCACPTYYEVISADNYSPQPLPGANISGLPDLMNSLYTEMRMCIQAECYTSAVLLARKLLMHMAVDKGAKPKLNFVAYVNYLCKNNYVPPDGKEWVEHIKDQGNLTNHEIVIMVKEDAMLLLKFIEGLFRINYEFIAAMPKKSTEDKTEKNTATTPSIDMKAIGSNH